MKPRVHGDDFLAVTNVEQTSGWKHQAKTARTHWANLCARKRAQSRSEDPQQNIALDISRRNRAVTDVEQMRGSQRKGNESARHGDQKKNK